MKKRLLLGIIFLIMCTLLFAACDEATFPTPGGEGGPNSPSSEETVPCGHEFGDWTTRIEAACGKEGKMIRTCTLCSSKEESTIPKTGNHTLVVDGLVYATCTENGLTPGMHCSECGTVTIAQEVVPAFGHTVVVDNGVASTCTQHGKTEGSHCSTCGMVMIQQTATPLAAHMYDHDYDDCCNVCDRYRNVHCAHEEIEEFFAVTPTCTSTGLTAGKRCKLCEKILLAQRELPVLGHSAATDNAVAATCTTKGKTAGSHCSRCNTVLTAQKDVAALGHSAVTDNVVAATCTTKGKTAGSHCSRCNTVLTAQKEIAALGHSAGQWIVDKAATTMQTGSRRQVCATCGITLRRETIPVVTVSYDTNYAAYNQPESNDFARWDGSKEVKGSGTVADEVKWIQAALNYCIAYKGLNATPVTVDGTFDASCKAATLAFQKANGLDQDGSFGPNTIAKMKTVVPSTFEQQNIIQYNTSKTGDFLTGSWATYRGSGKYDDTISSSGCGIVALVSAVYNLGDTIEKDKVGTAIKDVFDWAYGKYWIDYTKWTLFAASDEKFGDKYGFNVLETNNTYGCYGQYGKVDTDLSHLVSHLKNNKGTAVVHVYGHFMAAVDYRVFNEKEQILIFDPGPGDMGSSKRGGLTKAEGSWIDLDVLKNGKTASKLNWSTSSSLENIEIDGYWLISKK